MSLDKELELALSSAGSKVAAELTVDLQDKIVETGWPRELSDAVSVGFDVDTAVFFIEVDPDKEGAIYDAEYGNGDLSPAPVLRLFETSMNRDASRRMDVLLQEELVTRGIL